MLIAAVWLVAAFGVVQAQDEQLVLWTRYDLADTENGNAINLNAKIAEFEAATGITVVHEQVAWDQMSSKLAITVQSGGDVPDIAEIGSQHIPSLLDAGALMPLDDVLAGSSFVDELNEADQRACVIDGTRYCVAHNLRGGATYYRTGLFPDGFPQTSAAWLSTAPALSEGDRYFNSQYMGRSYVAIEAGWWPMIYSNGGDIFDAEGKPAWASDAVVEVVEFTREMYGNEYLPPLNITGDFVDAEAPWLDGTAASFRGASWSPIFVPGLKDAVDSGAVAVTGGVDFGGGSAVLLMSEAFVVAAGASNPDAAALWLESFYEPVFLARWAETQFGIPTTEAAYAAGDFDSGFFGQMGTVLATQGVFMQRSPFYIESLDTLAVAFQELLLDPELDALERLAAAEEEVLNRYW